MRRGSGLVSLEAADQSLGSSGASTSGSRAIVSGLVIFVVLRASRSFQVGCGGLPPPSSFSRAHLLNLIYFGGLSLKPPHPHGAALGLRSHRGPYSIVVLENVYRRWQEVEDLTRRRRGVSRGRGPPQSWPPPPRTLIVFIPFVYLAGRTASTRAAGHRVALTSQLPLRGVHLIPAAGGPAPGRAKTGVRRPPPVPPDGGWPPPGGAGAWPSPGGGSP